MSLWGRANEMYSYSTLWCSMQQAAKPALWGIKEYCPPGPAAQTLTPEVSGDLAFLAGVNALSQASVMTQHHDGITLPAIDAMIALQLNEIRARLRVQFCPLQ